jgi:hypothetical protein
LRYRNKDRALAGGLDQHGDVGDILGKSAHAHFKFVRLSVPTPQLMQPEDNVVLLQGATGILAATDARTQLPSQQLAANPGCRASHQ